MTRCLESKQTAGCYLLNHLHICVCQEMQDSIQSFCFLSHVYQERSEWINATKQQIINLIPV